ncbi:alpha/beta fold hydrolase [Kordiimonas lacus]|uniref:Dipeptidyl-peptidase-4 n=1 Tax=Kordiimonas lacus TaxID=637679 RepID=A0A1G7CLB7_9PROT|nr:alpha/beta fold hydrolase [Kordiimonas lacus]SDE40204.1 dipeptidyl-peptidase-4 [Kordiimonas lacus]
MKKMIQTGASFLALSALTAGTAGAEDLTIERLVGSPSISGPSVQGLEMSPDGRRITFLQGKAENKAQLDLWQYDIETGEASLLVDSAVLLGGKEEELSEEEKARRERDRSLTGKRGIVSYEWNADGTSLLFPVGGDVYVLPIGGDVKRLTDTPEFETDIQFSPKGRYVSFIRDRELYAIDIESGLEIQLSSGASETVSNGMAEFAAQEELGRYTGYWWSPDEAAIAFQQVDESPVEIKDRYEIQGDGSVITHKQRYPSAGTPNVKWNLKIVRLNKPDEPKDLALAADVVGTGGAEYLARVDWLASSNLLVAQTLNRTQTELTYNLIAGNGNNRVFPKCGPDADKNWVVKRDGNMCMRFARKLTSDVWINLNDDFETIGYEEVLVSRDWPQGDAGSFNHILRYKLDTGEFTPITSGNWSVNEIEHVDRKAGLVYFTGYKDSPLEQHLYSVPLKGGEVKRITREAGWHKVTVSEGVFVDKFESPDQPPQVMVRNLADGSTRFAILENKLDASHPFGPYLDSRVKTTFGTIKADDGTDLYYRMYQPATMDAGRKYPAVLAPYGGPHGQKVRHDWHLGFNHILARNGFVVLVLDNRGMANRGLKFESHIKHAMGTVEVADQVAGANFLMGLDYIDRDNIGFWGWSYGGYMTLMALFQAPDVFKAGVSVAPVTDWRLYDTAYTERYLGLPDAPGNVYENSSVFKYIDGFKGKLLLIHGMADDNVFFDNSVKLMSTLQNAGKPFELMTYPGKKHGIRGEAAQAHLYNQALAFFKRTLQAD